MPPIFTHKINTQHILFAQVFALREKVLRQPIGLSLFNEDTSGDTVDDIFVVLVNDTVIGCVMSKPMGEGLIKLRQMAVDEDWQNKGIGKILVQAAEKDARQNGHNKIQLHARKKVIGFYEKLGYSSFGQSFTEVGLPHIAMEKLL